MSLSERPFGTSAVGNLFAAKRTYAASHLTEFRGMLEAQQHAGCIATDEMLCRHLEANVSCKGLEVHDVSLTAASDMLAATLKWRSEYGADKLTSCADCDENPFAHCFFDVGREYRSLPVLHLAL